MFDRLDWDGEHELDDSRRERFVDEIERHGRRDVYDVGDADVVNDNGRWKQSAIW